MSNSLRPHGLYSPWNSPGQTTGMGSLSLFQQICPTKGSNPGLLCCRQILYQFRLVILIMLISLTQLGYLSKARIQYLWVSFSVCSVEFWSIFSVSLHRGSCLLNLTWIDGLFASHAYLWQTLNFRFFLSVLWICYKFLFISETYASVSLV